MRDVDPDETLAEAFDPVSERINLLKDEIGRLEAEMVRKRASQTAADAFFKK